MIRYILWRLAGMVAVLYILLTMTFFIMHAIPGGPFDEEKMRLPEAVKAAILRSFGLDEPILVQYLRYLWNAAHLDFGRSYESPGESVTAVIGRVWPVSFHLGVMALTLGLVGGIGLGILSASRQNSWLDHAVTLLSTLGIVLPQFMVAILFVVVFSSGLQWLPPGGWDTPRHWLMPVLAYALFPLGTITRYTRACVLETLHADYVRTARAKGLGEGYIMLRHVLKNALIPVVTVIGPLVPAMLTGTIFIEAIFRVPGMGKFFVSSIFERDYPMIMGLSLLSAAFVSLTYLVTDLLYVAIDPRVELK
ncbi:MAG: ABC transporter permease [Chloroflexi bacterium]|nr:ABC transporter permease [Chloroflexota bacterium]